MGLATLNSDVKALVAAVKGRKASPILRTAAPVFVDGADILDLFVDPNSPPLFGADPEKAACKVSLEELVAECKKMQAEPPVVGADSFGKLFPGDGTFLKAMIEFAMALAKLLA